MAIHLIERTKMGRKRAYEFLKHLPNEFSPLSVIDAEPFLSPVVGRSTKHPRDAPSAPRPSNLTTEEGMWSRSVIKLFIAWSTQYPISYRFIGPSN